MTDIYVLGPQIIYLVSILYLSNVDTWKQCSCVLQSLSSLGQSLLPLTFLLMTMSLALPGLTGKSAQGASNYGTEVIPSHVNIQEDILGTF